MVEILIDFYAEPRDEGESISYVTEVFNTSAPKGKKNTKRKIEVKVRDLTMEDRKLFDLAKKKEWTSWLEKDAIELVKSSTKVSRSHILKARWVLTWKNVGTEKQPKARLCVLGFQDPRLTRLETSSPTLTADGENLIMQWIVNAQVMLESGDLKTAFLSGDDDPGRLGVDAIYVDLPADIKAWLKLGPDEHVRLRKAVYGLINAPLMWHKRLSRALHDAGFVPLQLDECMWVLPSGGEHIVQKPVLERKKTFDENQDDEALETTDEKPCEWAQRRKIHGVLGVHVDDLLGGGDMKFRKAIEWLKKELEFGAWEQRKFRFRGRELEQATDNKAIVIKMTQFVDEMETIAVPKGVREDPGQELGPQLHTQYRGGAGQLQWLQMQGNPALAFDTSILMSQCSAPKGDDLLALNKVIRTAKTLRDCSFSIVSMPMRCVFVTLADAAWANRTDGSSTCGHIILTAHKNILRGERVPVSVVAWKSRKIHRKVRSSLGAECSAMSTGLEHTDLVRVLWGELTGDLVDLAEYSDYLRAMDAIAINDCKSLADAIISAGSAASKTSEDKRLAIELSMIKQRLKRDETQFQWVENKYMAADILTKGMARGNLAALQKLLEERSYQIKATEEMMQERERAREIAAGKKKQ